MISIKSDEEIKIMRHCNGIVGKTREGLKKHIKPGISTLELDKIAEDHIRSLGAVPAFKGYHGFPSTLCTSINDEVVHGIPSKNRILKDGDIISVDIGAIYKGYYGDSAMSCGVGKISEEAQRLMDVTEKSLYKGINAAQVNGRLNDIGAAVQEYVESQGFSVVRDFVGHGIGQQLHEEPQVPNYGKRGTGMVLQAGMVIAIEPMVNVGSHKVKILSDGWTAVTEDGKLAAHFEHTIALTKEGPQILSEAL